MCVGHVKQIRPLVSCGRQVLATAGGSEFQMEDTTALKARNAITYLLCIYLLLVFIYPTCANTSERSAELRELQNCLGPVSGF